MPESRGTRHQSDHHAETDTLTRQECLLGSDDVQDIENRSDADIDEGRDDQDREVLPDADPLGAEDDGNTRGPTTATASSPTAANGAIRFARCIIIGRSIVRFLLSAPAAVA